MRASPITLYDAAGDESGSTASALIFGTKGPSGQLGRPLDLEQIYGYSIQAFYLDGSPAGTLSLQASNDGTSWCEIPGTPVTVTGTGSFLWNVSSSNYRYVRLAWVTAGGGSTGHLSAIAFVRGF